MTKRQIRKFFNYPEFEYENGVWWDGNKGYLLFDRCFMLIFGRNTDKPALLLVQKLRDIPFILYNRKKGVVVGSRKMTREAEVRS